MSKDGEIKIRGGNQYYGGAAIAKDVKRINKDENLAGELGIFRLASVHKDLDLAHQASNAVLVNLRIKFITKTGAEVEHIIPVMVTRGDGAEALTYYSGSQVEDKEFVKFYQSIKPGVKEVTRTSHYHSEPFLAYYLCSKDGKNFLVREFAKKGLIAVSDDGKTYESNVGEITGIGMDLHSTRVVCFNCGPFLKAAAPRLLAAINWALVLPDGKKPSKIEFNVSANKNFDWSNISRADTFDHIPVMESDDENILTNTEKALGESRVMLQKVGESSNRTYFLSGSGAVDADTIALRDLDEKKWQIVATAASVEIQRMWRGFSERKKIKQEQVRLKTDELSELRESIGEKEEEIEKLREEISAFEARLELIEEINDLAQRIDDGEIDGEEEVDEIEDLYERATADGLFEETENSSHDANSKLDFLLELQGTEKSLKRQKTSAASNLDDLESELEDLAQSQEDLEQQIKDLISVAPPEKSAEKKAAKKAAPKNGADADLEDDLDIFNYVGESSNLTHQNVLYLIEESFELAGIDASQTAVAVISEDDSLDHCLRDEILKFIGQDPEQDRISIALCRGHLDEESQQIEGNTHWTALHLRRVENGDGTVSIRSYYMDSMGKEIPGAVERVLGSIATTTMEDLNEDLAENPIYGRAIERLENTSFNPCKVLGRPTKQTDHYSCGYHAVFNMMRMHNLVRGAAGLTYKDEVTQGDEEVAVEKFIADSKVTLQTHFNQAIGNILNAHAKFSVDMDLNRALSESILVSEDGDLDKLKNLLQLEREIKKSEKDPAMVLSSLNLEKFYKKLLAGCVEKVRYEFLAATEGVASDEEDMKKREQILEKLSSSKTAQNPQDFLEILERIVADPTLLSSSLDDLLEEVGEIEKTRAEESAAAAKTPLPHPAKAKTEKLAVSAATMAKK